MSNVPPDYVKSHSFTTLALQPITTAGLPGSQIDAEFVAVATTVNQTIDRLSEIQQDDGKLRSGVVTIGSLSPETAAAISTTGATISGQWAAGITYHPGDIIIYGPDSYAYICAVQHTASANFESDFSAKSWAIMGYRPATNDLVVKTFNGTGSQTTFNLEINPVSENNTQVFVSGVYKSKSTYSISGTNLIFATAPAAGTGNIEVVIGVAAELINNVVTIPNNSVGTAAIINLNVTGAKIADLTITSGKLADQAVTSAKIENNAVGSTKITDLAITTDKLAGGAVTTAKIASGSITTALIADSSIETTKLAVGAVTSAKMASGAALDNLDTASILPAKLSAGAPVWNSAGLLSSTSFATGTITGTGLASLSSLSVSTTSTFTGAATFSSQITLGTAPIPVPSGTAPVYGARAWGVFDGDTFTTITSSSITRTGTVVTVNTTNPHGFSTGDIVPLNLTQFTDGFYVVTGTPTTTSFTFTTAEAPGSTGSASWDTCSIIQQGNVKSVLHFTSNDGQYAINFTTDMPDANYAVCGSVSDVTNRIFRLNSTAQKTSRGFSVAITSGGGTAQNAPEILFSVFR
jgi:hypothetical protein